MAFFPRPVTIVMLRIPASTASSITYWMRGLSTSGNISLGWALVAGKKRVPKPAAGKTAFEMRMLLLAPQIIRSEEHTSELQSLAYLVCRLLLEKKKNNTVDLNPVDQMKVPLQSTD